MYTAFEMQMERCQREMLFNYFIFLLVNWIEDPIQFRWLYANKY